MWKVFGTSKAEIIWKNARSGDGKALAKNLTGATPADLTLEKMDEGFLFQPIGIAAEKGFVEIVRMLAVAGAELDFRGSDDGRTALHRASYRGHTSTVQVLSDARADTNIQDNDGRTPLHLACERGHHETAQALLRARAVSNICDVEGKTALQLASSEGHTATVQALLDSKADVNIQDKDGWTALHKATFVGHVAIVQALIDAGANPHLKNKFGWTVEDVANTQEVGLLITPSLQDPISVSTTATPTFASWASTAEPEPPLPFVPEPEAPVFAPCPVPSAPPVEFDLKVPLMDLVQECCKIITEAAQVASFRTTTQQRDEKKKRYEAARAEGKDFIVVVQLGKALKAAEAELSQHPLSEEGYLTLAERHDALVDKVTAKCQQLMKEEDLDALEVLATKLAELKALDLSTLPKSWANDPVQASSNPVQLESLPKSIDDWRFPVFSDLEDWTQTPVSFAKDVSIPTYAPCSLTCQAEEQDGFMDDPVMPPADAVFSPAFPVESAKFDDWADFASFS